MLGWSRILTGLVIEQGWEISKPIASVAKPACQMVQLDDVYSLSEHFSSGLKIADLNLLFEDGGSKALDLDLSSSHQEFLLHDKAEVNSTSAFSSTLVLQLQETEVDRHSTWKQLIYNTKIWELWKDQDDQFVFFNPLQPLLRQVVVNPDFTHGQLLGEFQQKNNKVRPLPQGLEIVLFSNWLAKFGDVILHASGFIYEGKAYVFAGDAGVGKSTLAAQFLNDPAFTVIGEDQVILRLKNGRFWVYGTPWHINPQMCSPNGAPLENLFFLEKNGRTRIDSLTPIEGVERLMQTAFIPYYRLDVIQTILDRIVLLSENIQFYSLSYQMGMDVWKLIDSI